MLHEKIAYNLGRLVAVMDALLRVERGCCDTFEIATPDCMKLQGLRLTRRHGHHKGAKRRTQGIVRRRASCA